MASAILNDSKTLCEESRLLRATAKVTVSESQEAVARSRQIIARIKEWREIQPHYRILGGVKSVTLERDD
jgi:hypothetical protein